MGTMGTSCHSETRKVRVLQIGRWPNWLRFVIWDHESAGSSPVLPTGSNLVVIKTQGVLKGYTGDNYSSHRIEDGIYWDIS